MAYSVTFEVGGYTITTPLRGDIGYEGCTLDIPICDCCGKACEDVFVVDGGTEHYCSEECLHTKYSREEWDRMYDEDSDSNYYTEYYSEYDILMDIVRKLYDLL